MARGMYLFRDISPMMDGCHHYDLNPIGLIGEYNSHLLHDIYRLVAITQLGCAQLHDFFK